MALEMTARDRYLRAKYGITERQYNQAWAKQGQTCKLCKRPRRAGQKAFAVDHDHATLELRSVVCYFCNRRRIGRHDLHSALDLVQYFENPTFINRFAPKRKRRKRK